MDEKKDAFMKRLLSAFRVEADEHIKNMTAGIIELEKNLPPQVKAEIVETVFREAHSLKGGCPGRQPDGHGVHLRFPRKCFLGFETGRGDSRLLPRYSTPCTGPSTCSPRRPSPPRRRAPNKAGWLTWNRRWQKSPGGSPEKKKNPGCSPDAA